MNFRRIFRRAAPAPQQHWLPVGERIYAIGDIHGRLDCLDTLIAMIDADGKARDVRDTTLIFLGDLMDRGAESRGVIERAMEIGGTRRSVFLMGNHEEVFIHAYEGDDRAAAVFHRIGGRETMMSYGVSAAEYDSSDLVALTRLLGDRVPDRHIAFLRSFVDSIAVGDYFFAHAGIRPGMPLDAQDPATLRWIRREFLDDRRDHGAMVIHGHSITDDVDQQANRIGVDTGAFASGKLTAIGIEGCKRWYLST